MRALVLAVSFVLATAGVAHADQVGVVVTGEATMQPQLVNQLEAWLKLHGHQLVKTPLPPDAINTLVDCFVIEDEGCARKVIEKRAKSAIVYARVDIQAGGDLEKTVTVLAYWFAKGQPAVAERRFCQRCSETTMRSTTDDLMKALSKAGQRTEAGKLKLTSNQVGAKVKIDGQPAGVMPLDQEVVVGPHEITVSHDGDSETRFVEVKAGETLTLDVPVGVAKAGGGGGGSKILPIALLAGGAAMVVTGGVLISIDEDVELAGQQKAKFRDTAGAGVGLAITGLAVAGIGTYFMFFRKESSAPVAAVTSDSAYVGWMGRF
ncbi:MAG: PEGA domain-containing protein [Kofleriaceae bacterium]